uniref:Uncharacterized protein n=1 Tax=Anguilla anguilla TaxID=7936 RepID=A0A0E9RNH6_ANGAN
MNAHNFWMISWMSGVHVLKPCSVYMERGHV